MNQGRIHPAAEADANAAADWYERQRTGLGIEFTLELLATIDNAIASPFAYQALYSDVRRSLMRRFPYAVYFVVGHGVVEVIAVLHQHQSPEAWQLRL